MIAVSFIAVSLQLGRDMALPCPWLTDKSGNTRLKTFAIGDLSVIGTLEGKAAF